MAPPHWRELPWCHAFSEAAAACHWLIYSVPVLMLKVPAVKINVESHNAARRHASDQSPEREKTVSFRVALYLSLWWTWSQTSDHVTGPWLGCLRHSRDRRRAAWSHRLATLLPPRCLLQSLDSAHHYSREEPEKYTVAHQNHEMM